VSPIRRRRTFQVLVLVVLAAAAVGAGLLLRPQLASDSTAAGSSGQASSSGQVGVPSPTGSVANAAASPTAPYTIKPEPSRVATDAARPTGGSHVDVVLSFAGFDGSSGAVQANGFAAGVIENGGTCTLTLTRGADEVTATSAAEADASTTNCGLLQTSSGLTSGTWKAVLSYSSAKAQGQSGSTEVTVP
jgi:hypothetical protein